VVYDLPPSSEGSVVYDLPFPQKVGSPRSEVGVPAKQRLVPRSRVFYLSCQLERTEVIGPKLGRVTGGVNGKHRRLIFLR